MASGVKAAASRPTSQGMDMRSFELMVEGSPESFCRQFWGECTEPSAGPGCEAISPGDRACWRALSNYRECGWQEGVARFT